MIEERVARGVAWLDANYPDWRSRVNPESLDMGHERHCILGQVMGDFFKVKLPDGRDIDHLGWWDWMSDHGFYHGRGPGLKTAWLAVLGQR